MRIAILTSVFSPEYGVARVIAAQIPYLLQAGMVVDVYACETRNRVAVDGVQVVRVPTHLQGLRAALDDGGYDVVIAHTHPFFHLLPLLRGGAATLLYEHGMPPADRFPAGAREERMRMVADMVDKVYPAVTQVVTISDYAASYIGWGAAKVIYNGADHYTRWAQPVPPGNGPIQVLCVSRYGKEEQRYKGLDDLTRLAMDLGAAFAVVLVGSGPEEERAQLLAKGLQVVEYKDDAQLAALYRTCDAFVSFSHWETFNLPLGEAGFFHKPALALDIGPHREVTPFVFADYAALRDYLGAASRESLRLDGERMFAHVTARFRWEQNGNALVRLLRELKPRTGGRRPGWRMRGAWMYWKLREGLRQLCKSLRFHG